MPRTPRILSIDDIQKYLAKIMMQVEKGQIDTKRANAISNLAGKLIYAYQVQNKEDEIEVARQILERQEIIMEAIRTGNRAKLIDLKEGID